MPSYHRYPHIHDDLITFTGADDIWLASTQGGRAWRLTDDSQPVRTPRFSPDGQHIAFISFKDGHPEVYVVPVDGNASPKRLTYWGAKNTLVLGWTDDGRILAATHAGEDNLRHTVAKAVGLDGSVERLEYGPTWGVAIAHDGRVVVGTPGSRPPAQWKRYRGGTAPKLWMKENDEWRQLLAEDTASLVDPMWINRTLIFVSDREAELPGPRELADKQANLWALDDVDGEPRKVTDQGPDQGYVRDASTDGKRVVWHSKGNIYLLDSLASEPRRVEITLPGSAPETRLAAPSKRLGRPVPDHGGDASLVAWRGNAYWLTHREGPARALVAESSVRVRQPVLLGQTGFCALVTDSQGEDSIEIHHLAGEEETRGILTGELGRILHLVSDPEGSRLCAISHDGRVSIIDIESGEVKEVGQSRNGEPVAPTFSPQGRYLMWSQPAQSRFGIHQLMAYDTEAGEEPAAVTTGTYHDHSARFTRDGAHIVFLSDRTFDPEYDRHEFGLSFSDTTRPWLIPLSAEQPPPFGPTADGWRISAEKPANGDDDSADEAESEDPEFDVDGAEDRAIPFPVPSGTYRRLETTEAGVLWIQVNREDGQLGSKRAGVTGEPPPNTLQLWSWKKRSSETIVDAVTDYSVSGDGKQLVVRHKQSMFVHPADRKAEEKDPGRVPIDLSRLRFEIDPALEWAQMFDETTRLMRDHFWREDMDGVDWDAVVERWRPVVDTIATHDDLVDVLWETVGELNTSHAYVMPTTPPGDQKRKLGLLGADLSPTDGGWHIDRILPGESSDPAARSPLRAAGVDAREGDLITEVDGVQVDSDFGPARHLIGAANKPVELTLQRGDSSRRVAVVPVDDEETLRYQGWVRSRREYVDEHSEGRLGYVHVPDMMSVGWAQLHRDLRHATLKEGLIVDVRFNRGGHTSQLVLQRIAKRVIGWTIGRHAENRSTYPNAAPRGPVVLVANENSGSDGDIINAASQAVGVGPVIGVRTWGGVVGIDGRFDLVDGTVVTQPRYASWFEGKDWGVENHGVDPDIEVIHTPADFFSDADPQLDRAIAESLSRLEDEPAAAPPPLPDPKVS